MVRRNRLDSSWGGVLVERVVEFICLPLVLLVAFGLGNGSTTSAQLGEGGTLVVASAASLVWVRDADPVVNANNDPTESFPPEPRFAGSYTKMTPTATRFTTQECYVDNQTQYYNLSVVCTFATPPPELSPGTSYSLTGSFSHSGTNSQGGEGIGEQFWYSSSAQGLVVPAAVLKYYPWSPNFSGPSAQTWTLTAPQPTAGATFQVYAGLWNRPPCNVTWTYRAQEKSTVPASAGTSTTAALSGAESEYGVIEIDGVIHLISPPGGVLRISQADLPTRAIGLIARVGDSAICVGPPSTIMEGDYTVLLDGKPVARLGDHTSHGGIIVSGNASILVNGIPAATFGDMVTCPMTTGLVPHVGGPIIPDQSDQSGLSESSRPKSYQRVSALLAEMAEQGATRIKLVDDGPFRIGDVIMIGGDNPETIEAARVAGKGSLILDRPLLYDHAATEWVVRVPDEYAGLLEPPPGGTAVAAGQGPGSTFGSNLSWILPLIIVGAVVAAAAVGAGVYLRRRRRGGSGVGSPIAAAGVAPDFCRDCGSAVQPDSPVCPGCGRKF